MRGLSQCISIKIPITSKFWFPYDGNDMILAKLYWKCEWYIAKAMIFNNHMWKFLKAQSVIINILILEGMNVLTMKHYILRFQNKIC
jgi:hypothetical protein